MHRVHRKRFKLIRASDSTWFYQKQKAIQCRSLESSINYWFITHKTILYLKRHVQKNPGNPSWLKNFHTLFLNPKHEQSSSKYRVCQFSKITRTIFLVFFRTKVCSVFQHRWNTSQQRLFNGVYLSTLSCDINSTVMVKSESLLPQNLGTFGECTMVLLF